MNTWKRITEEKPAPGDFVLVCDRGNMFTSTADFYSEEQLAEYREWANTKPEWISEKNWLESRDHWLNCTGRFSDFGQKSYFDDPKVFWMELPEEPKNV